MFTFFSPSENLIFHLGCWVYSFPCQNGFRIDFYLLFLTAISLSDCNCKKRKWLSLLWKYVAALFLGCRINVVAWKCFINLKGRYIFRQCLPDFCSEDSVIQDSFVLAPSRKINLFFINLLVWLFYFADYERRHL